MPLAEDDDPISNDELPDAGDLCDDDDETDLVRCGHCGAMIADDSPQCPHCKTWGPLDEAGRAGGAWRRAWTIIVLLMIGIILVVWHGLGR